MIVCEFCGNSFSSKYILKTHQSKALYCLEIQKERDIFKDPDLFECSNCMKQFTRKGDLARHSPKCKGNSLADKLRESEKQNKELIEKLRDQDKEITKLQTRLEEKIQLISELRSQLSKKEESQQNLSLAAISRPTTNIRNTIKNAVIQNLIPLKEDEMKKHTSFLTMDHIKEGPEGYAKFALSHPFKDRITCTDISRKKLAWKNEAGEIIYDSEGQQLSEKFFRIMRERNETLCKEIIRELGERLGDAWKRDDYEEANAIAELTDKIQTWRREAFQASKGNNTDLSEEFSKALCKISTRKDQS